MPFINSLLRHIDSVIVETSTFKGDTLDRVANNNICKPDKIISKDNILVTYIQEKLCIHTYLTRRTSPGLADFIRGTITLYNLSKEYGYTLYIDNSHPLFKFLKNNEKIISRDLSSDVIELFPVNIDKTEYITYDELYYKLVSLFLTNKSFVISTNSFYTINNLGVMLNWGAISDDCRLFLKEIFRPSLELENKIEYIFNSVYKIKRENYKVIHLRFGDNDLNRGDINIYKYILYSHKIQNLINNNMINKIKDVKYILISDSQIIASKLSETIKELYYWDNNKIHLGDLSNTGDINLAISDTLIDFFIMSGSNEILSNGSGFSNVVSLINNIKYTNI
jgi:hypothetical protein